MQSYSTRAKTPEAQELYFRRHENVIRHLKRGGGPTVDAITDALDYPKGTVTEHHLTLCKQIRESPLKFILPRTNTEHVQPFAAVAGPDNTSGKGTPGCYLLASSSFMDKPITPGVQSPCYIGHSTRLGKRVKEHAKGLEINTSTFLNKLGKDANVFLFLVTPEIRKKLEGLPLLEFLCVLEQYLFMLYFPAINRSRVATAGVLQSPQAVAKLREATGNKLYIYQGTKSNLSIPLVLRYIYPSVSFASQDLLGYNRLALRDIIRRGV